MGTCNNGIDILSLYATYNKGLAHSTSKQSNQLKTILTPYGQIPAVCNVPAKTTVSKQLAKILPNITCDDPILIDAGTGFGKTSGVLDAIVIPEHERRKTCHQGNEELSPSIWFISPRSALNLQFKQRIARAVEAEHLLDEHTTAGLLREEVFGPVRVMTYQALWKLIEAENSKFDLPEYLIFDEIHALALDSTFVEFSWQLLLKIPITFRKSKRIYLSATSEPILPYLTVAECPRDIPFPVGISRRITIYRWPKKYDQFMLHFYHSYENIVEYAKVLPSTEKMLIFVPSIAQGEAILQQLQEESILITSKTRFELPELWKDILSGKPLSYRFLISTLTLDAGISIIDPDLNHIVCSGLDMAEILQQAGRKRLMKDEKQKLYIWSPDKKQINNLLFHVRSQLKAIETYKTNYPKFVNRYILKDECVGIRNFCFLHKEKIIPNDLAVEYLRYKEAYYSKLLSSSNPWPVDRAVCRALKQNLPEDKSKWLDARHDGKPQEDFHIWLSENMNKPMEDLAQREFSKKFQALYQAAFGKSKDDRSDRDWGINKLNKKLAAINWGITLKSSRGIWMLTSNVDRIISETD